MVDLVLRPMAEAFFQVGVFVALFSAAAVLVRWRWGRSLSDAVAGRRRAAPLLGAVLGVSPGCSGAILIGALYAKRKVSFGTLVAALTATMGDASWVLMAADLRLAGMVHLVLFVSGLATGYAVDALRVAPPVPHQADPGASTDRRRATAPVTAYPGAAVARAAALLRTDRRLAAVVAPAAFWAMAGVGGVLALPMTLQMATPADVAALAGGVDVTLVLGVAGTLVALGIFVTSGYRLRDDTPEAVESGDLLCGLRHGAQETAFVIVWVAVAFVAQGLLAGATAFDAGALPLYGVAGVVVGALVGLIPGCGIQITFTGLFLAGGVPLPALMANAVAQDGDALLPLLAMDRRAAVAVTLLTTLPALAVGCAFLLVV